MIRWRCRSTRLHHHRLGGCRVIFGKREHAAERDTRRLRVDFGLAARIRNRGITRAIKRSSMEPKRQTRYRRYQSRPLKRNGR